MNKEDQLEYLNKNETNTLLKVVNDSRDLAIIRLFLSAGLYLNEIPELNIDSIDWENKILQIKTTRPRKIPINSELLNALVAWSHERVDNPSAALFITSKGNPTRLSSRAIDKLVRKYGVDAGIQRKVNAQILRNTFAVQFFASEISIDNASYILGITSPKAIRRYIKAAQMEKEGKFPKEELEKLDKRPKIIQRITKLIPRKPKEAKIIKPSPPSDGQETTVGRNAVLNDIRENLSRGRSTLLVGDVGIGKTHLLKAIANENNYLYLSSPAPVKQFLQKICEKYCPDWAEQLPAKSRSSTREIVEVLTARIEHRTPFAATTSKSNNQRKKEILIVDNLDKLKISDLEIILILLDSFAVLAATDETPERLKRIWWKFRRIDLPPLTTQASKELIENLTSGLTIVDHHHLETRILSHAGGLPLAIVEMINQIGDKPLIRKEDIRDLYHEAGVRYRDWSPILLILWGIAMISRFVALGSHSFEGYILAGSGMAVIMTVTKFLRKR